MNKSKEEIEREMREAANEQGLALDLPDNAFLLAKKTPQGWLFNGFPDLGMAFEKAGFLARQGNTDVYVLNCANGGVAGFDGDGQPDW